jgi:hypothetical protein
MSKIRPILVTLGIKKSQFLMLIDFFLSPAAPSSRETSPDIFFEVPHGKEFERLEYTESWILWLLWQVGINFKKLCVFGYHIYEIFYGKLLRRKFTFSEVTKFMKSWRGQRFCLKNKR